MSKIFFDRIGPKFFSNFEIFQLLALSDSAIGISHFDPAFPKAPKFEC